MATGPFTLSGCVFTGNVSGRKIIGGIAGYADNGHSESSIYNNSFEGVIEAEESPIGYMVGRENWGVSFSGNSCKGKGYINNVLIQLEECGEHTSTGSYSPT